MNKENQLEEIELIRENITEIVKVNSYLNSINKTKTYIPESLKQSNQKNIVIPSLTPEFNVNEHKNKSPLTTKSSSKISTPKSRLKFTENLIYKKEYDIDRRDRITTIREYPHCAIGIIISKNDENKPIYGTGTLIGKNIVFTCAHNVYNVDKKEFYNDIIFGIKLVDNTFDTIVNVLVDTIFIPDDYKNDRDSSDYCIFQIDKDLGSTFGYLGLAFDHEIQEDLDYYLYGYNELDLVNRKFSLYGMKKDPFGSFRLVDEEDISKGQINYTAFDTDDGTSGGPIFFNQNGSYFIMGVHLQGCALFNFGSYLKKERFKLMINWLIENKIESDFLIKSKSLDLSDKMISPTNRIVSLTLNNEIKDVTELYLSGNNLKSEWKNHFVNFIFSNLTLLDLSNNDIGNDGLKSLTDCDLKNLTTLNLSCNEINDSGVIYIDQCNFKNLRILDLSNNNITEKGVDNICNSISQNNFQELISIIIDNEEIGENALAFLKSLGFNYNGNWFEKKQLK